ncbi:hypothetical protein [Pantoea sp. MBLJ3]|uniref:hypothetical protein n=1 Tax=Pantoea sp. MBLJ3 TaxID=1562889 RepID=UPI00057DED10|nr:hypothetical protein [Pantoea sp. MBLJ3]
MKGFECFFEIGFKLEEVQRIERLWHLNAIKFSKDYMHSPMEKWEEYSKSSKGFIYYPSTEKIYHVQNLMNQSEGDLTNKEYGAFLSMMILNALCWSFEGKEQCQKLSDLYYETRDVVYDDFFNLSLVKLLD